MSDLSEAIEPAVANVRVQDLRKVLQKFNGDLGQHMNDEKRFLLGRVLTIIDAAIPDQEQRKAVKDLVNNEWWNGNGMRPAGSSDMHSPHSDLRGLCLALGFEMFESKASDLSPLPYANDDSEWVKKKYKKELQTND